MSIELVLYPRIIETVLLATESSGTRYNMPMNEGSFKLFKNLKNVIYFSVKNLDKKPVNVTYKTINITIYDQNSNSKLLTKTLFKQNPGRGICTLTLADYETQYFPTGFISYIITFSDSTGGGDEILFLDQSETARGYFEVFEGEGIGPCYSQESSLINTSTPNNMSNISQQYWYSSSFMGSNQSTNLDGVVTLAIYIENFYGQISLYGSLNQSMPLFNDDSWYLIDNLGYNNQEYFTNYSGILSASVCSKSQWNMIKFTPALGVVNYTPTPGQITNIQFRN